MSTWKGKVLHCSHSWWYVLYLRTRHGNENRKWYTNFGPKFFSLYQYVDQSHLVRWSRSESVSLLRSLLLCGQSIYSVVTGGVTAQHAAISPWWCIEKKNTLFSSMASSMQMRLARIRWCLLCFAYGGREKRFVIITLPGYPIASIFHSFLRYAMMLSCIYRIRE